MSVLTTRLSRDFKLGVKNLLLHKLRSFLTMLGLVFGVGSVIAMLAIGEGASQEALAQIRKLGSRNILLTAAKPADDDSSGRGHNLSVYGLLYNDVRRLESSFPTVLSAIPVKTIEKLGRYAKRTLDLRLMGTTEEWFKVVPRPLEAGRLEALGTAPEILRVEDVRKIFTLRRAGLIERLAGGRDDVTVAVDGVTLSVRRGETVALVGESGCGKSTFARIAAGLLAPDGGKVTVNGKDVKVLGAGHVNMIFQDPYASLNPRMSVAAIWEEPLKSLRPEMGAPERRAKLRELARLVGLPEEALEKYPHEFSGGQRQRISVARAVAAGPDLLICDEPTSALDVSVQAQVLNLLKTLQLERGLSMLFISHNLGVVRHIADTVGVMYRGQIVEWAPKEALFEDPLHPYTRMLLDSVPRIDGGKRCTAKHAATEGDVPDGCPFAPRCAEARLECRSGKVFLEAVTGAQGLRKVACRRMR